ncbi:hypothetical protein [Sphingobacterium yanglingense]|uniref:HEPN domain-containing protein n=1 Tax=Sphingobacterium yanglingense TaxID=1437280 RepID=A0A4R6WG88_9SPHI|nr:hypothetical protein [Sphingobacterium yanglingense]TDQ77362.1 hypothetical protein CLV99_2767 [Sphingobacterium yanglingense]
MVHFESKEFDSLNLITNRLVSLVEIDQVYFSSYCFQGTSFKEVLVLIPKTNRQHITEVRPMVGIVMCKYSHLRYQIYYVDEVRRSIFRGGGAFIERCHFDNLIYINPKSTPVMSKIPDIEAYLKKAYESFEMECAKIKSFKDGAEYYLNRRHIPLCAFMLHQTFELLYRMTEIVFLGREKISHHLRNHHQLLLPYLPSLLTVFDTDQEYDMFLLEILNEAYLSVRYQNSYTVDMDDLDCLFVKSSAIEQLLTDSCSQMITYYERVNVDVQNISSADVLPN